ncbi:hypothetical protein AB0D45_11445 [Streptomyces sp. NPDC048352]|uniref:hypothetical protein n=1 Tax=Streptomyces sp. NPDC048352 TaxID=3154718 RepID=UPI00341D5ADD
MSYHQPGPYGQQPQQPGPYGQQPPPPPNPYGQQPQQPGYGYPQQAPPPPGPPQGYPQQGGYQTPPPPPAPQPAYGYQQQPQQPAYAPPPQPPKKSKAGPIIAVVVAVAVIAGGAWWFLGAGGPVSDDTKGYKLVAPESVGEFQKNPKYTEKPMTDKDKQEAAAAGIKNPTQVGMSYLSGDPKNPLSQKGINFSGVYGDIADPEKTVDGYFALFKLKTSETNDKSTAELIGKPKEITPKGFEGAVLKCQDLKLSAKDPATAKGPKEFTLPICIWGDYSTLSVVSASDAVSILAGKQGYTLEQTADFAAQLYKTARVKK